MKFLSLFFFLLTFTNLSFSQVQELEDVTLEMLRETTSPVDSSAVAEVLYEKGEVSFSLVDSWEYDFEVTRRIKIYNQEGYDQANVQIPYYVGELNADEEKVLSIKGYVYYEENGEIERERLRNRDVYDIDLSDAWEAKKFTLPKIQDGVIIEYSYLIKSPHISNLPSWVFQNDIPTRYSEYVTKIPIEYLAYNARSKGYLRIESTNKSEAGFIYARSARSKVKTTIQENHHIGSNLPKIESETYVNNVSNYLTTITYELSSYKTDEFANKSVSRTWDDVAKTLSETDSYDKELTRVKYFQDDLKSVLKDKQLPKDKMLAIFDFVKKKMTWNEEERRYTSDKLHKVYEEQKGSSADINLMLTAMLREANLEANPVLSSTISNGIPFFPTITGFNYVFTHVDINGETFLLDATDPYASPNILPKRVLNWKGTILKPNGFETIDLIPSTSSSKVYQVQSKLTENGVIKGKCRIVSRGQFGWDTRKTIHKKSDEDLILNYQKQFKLNGITEVSSRNLEDLSKPVMQGFTFSEQGQFVEKIGNKIYLSPMLFLNSKQNPFKAEERLYPIDFTFPKNLEHFISIQIPEGYKVEYLPEKAIIKLGEDLISLTYLMQKRGDIVTVKVSQKINAIMILPQDYSLLKEFYSSLLTKENEKIVLVKA
jgi:hypothetical protein